MATKPKLMVDGVAGKVAIYTIDDATPGDRDPLDTPLSYLSRILFHSDLNYPQIVDVQTGTINFSTYSADQDISITSHNLFAHGQSGQPLVFGAFTNLSANPIPIAGSVPVQIDNYGFGRWVALGADATNVILTESRYTHRSGGLGTLSLNYKIWVTDFLLDQASPLPTPSSENIFIDETHFRAGGGLFDASNRYIRQANSSKEFSIIKGRSIGVKAIGNVTDQLFKYNVDGYLKTQTNSDGVANPDGTYNSLSFTATIKDVRTE